MAVNYLNRYINYYITVSYHFTFHQKRVVPLKVKFLTNI